MEMDLDPDPDKKYQQEIILPAGKRCLGCEHPAHFALQLGAGLSHQLGVVDQPVLGRVMLRFQGLDIMCT